MARISAPICNIPCLSGSNCFDCLTADTFSCMKCNSGYLL